MARTRMNAESVTKPPRRLRTRLKNIDDVCKELGRLYREARAGLVEVQDASRLANMLQILARCIEGGELERRLEALEKGHDR